jgi:acetyl esterase
VSPFPAAVEDAHAILVWARKNKTTLGWSGKQLIVAGIEAGANLAAVCALMSRDRGGPGLVGQILIIPMLDPGLTTCSMRSMPTLEQAELPTPVPPRIAVTCPTPNRIHPYASPLQSSRLKHLPQALILSVEDDPLRDEAEQYGTNLIGAGVKTTVHRLSSVLSRGAGVRNECVGRARALAAIAGFLAELQHSQGEPRI